jgi:hypothetical protein
MFSFPFTFCVEAEEGLSSISCILCVIVGLASGGGGELYGCAWGARDIFWPWILRLVGVVFSWRDCGNSIPVLIT